MDNNLEYERALEVYERICGEPDEGQREHVLLELIDRLRAVTSDQPKNSDAFHLLGLCYYDLSNISAETQRQAEDAFRSCLEIDPAHQYANLFLGHVLFDMKRYAEADERFAKIDPDFFAAKTQQWRVVKNDELRLCCRLETATTSVGFHELDELCQRYETAPEAEFIVPREIVVCLGELDMREALPRKTLRSYASRVLAMLNATDNLGIASLQEPITRLRKIAAD